MDSRDPKSDPQMAPKWVQNRVKKGSISIGYESKHCLTRDLSMAEKEPIGAEKGPSG